MLKRTILLVLLAVLNINTFAQTINRNTLDFAVRTTLGSKIEYGMKFLSYKKHMPDIVKNFDVENFRSGRNMLVFSKSAFVVDIPANEINVDNFFNPAEVAHVFDGQFVNANAEHSWNFSMKVSIKKINFRLQAYLIDESDKSLLSSYVQASTLFDTNFTPSYYVVQVLDNFSEGVKRMIIVSKFIPVEDKTLVISYHLSALDYRWYKKFNLFNMVKKIYAKRVISTLERTKSTIR